MVKMLKIFLLLSSGCILNSCFLNGSSIESSFTALTAQEYEINTQEVDLYFEGTLPVRDYIQIGFVEAAGGKDASNDLLIAHLQYRAHQQGADAVMNIKKTFKTKTAFSSDEPEKYDKYSLPVFMGTAIKYTDLVKADSIHSAGGAASFDSLAVRDLERTAAEKKFISAASAAGVVFIAAVIFAAIKNRPKEPDI